MRIAITISRGRISPLFEYAQTILVIDATEGREVGRETLNLIDLEAPERRVEMLGSREVDLLICGGILSSGLTHIESRGIRVFPWVAGTVPEVIEIALSTAAYLETTRGETDGETIVAITSKDPELDGRLDPRFGRCRYLVFVTDDDSYEVVENASAELLGGAGIQTAKTIADYGARAVITGSCGPNAFGTLNAALISVYTEVKGTVRELYARFKRGECPLATGPTVADHWGARETMSRSTAARGRPGTGRGRGRGGSKRRSS